jgi:hypothetical protein
MRWKYWTQWTFRPLKNAIIQTETHEMDVLDVVENETLESHNEDIGHNGYIGDRAKRGLVVQLVRTRRLHRRGLRFESCQDHNNRHFCLRLRQECLHNGGLPRPKRTSLEIREAILFKSVRCCNQNRQDAIVSHWRSGVRVSQPPHAMRTK